MFHIIALVSQAACARNGGLKEQRPPKSLCICVSMRGDGYRFPLLHGTAFSASKDNAAGAPTARRYQVQMVAKPTTVGWTLLLARSACTPAEADDDDSAPFHFHFHFLSCLSFISFHSIPLRFHFMFLHSMVYSMTFRFNQFHLIALPFLSFPFPSFPSFHFVSRHVIQCRVVSIRVVLGRVVRFCLIFSSLQAIYFVFCFISPQGSYSMAMHRFALYCI